jgi:hypothetical protein
MRSLVKAIAEHDYTKPLVNLFLSESAAPTFEQLDVFFQVAKAVISDETYSQTFTPRISQSQPAFVRFVEGFADDAKADWGKLWRLLQNAMSVLKEDVYALLFGFAERLLKGDVLQRRLVGAQILSAGAKSATFAAWRADTKIMTVLLEGDLHPQLLEKLGDFLDRFLSSDNLQEFWERTEAAHSSQRGLMLSIVARALEKLDSQRAADFLKAVASRDNLSPDLIDFLGNSLKKRVRVQPAARH